MSLRNYLARFTEESSKFDCFGDGDAIAAISEGLHTSYFLKSIAECILTNMAELME